MKKKYFAFLRRLQAKGRSNMYGAVPYLMRAFDLSREQAFAVICEWLDLATAVSEITTPTSARLIERTISAGSERRKLRRART